MFATLLVTLAVINAALAAPVPDSPFVFAPGSSAPDATLKPSSVPTPSPTPAAPAPTSWTAPAQMSDLSAFNITHFAAGSDNLRLATLPPDSQPPGSPAPDDGFSLLSTDEGADSSSSDASRTALQLLYPADSINPAARPLGGAEFYAAPLDLSNASSVTLTYSVYFPLNFDWVLGGKLPGLYGGRDGCSGGDPAEDCFSTRLMWRKGGVGELYLYAPKDKQPAALCDDPHSVCDAAYGLSVGRGAFRFPAGNWTTVSQTVSLNTPGKADGGFALDVNGVRVVARDDVYYRGTGIRAAALADPTGKKAKPTSTKHPKPTSSKHKPTPTADPGSDGDDGGLLGILGQPQEGGQTVSIESSEAVSSGSVAYDAQGLWDGSDDDGEGDSTPWGTDDDDLLASLGTNVALPVSTTASLPSATGGPGELGQETGAAAAGLMGTIGAQAPWGITATATASGMLAPSVTPTTSVDDGLGFLGLQAGGGDEAGGDSPPAQDGLDDGEDQAAPHLATFRGLFFSTFFGGHEEEWATPVDQYVLFRDFAMVRNT